mmetsp:Transcript_71649/g.200944  ORF Transcript_71649/g.200944 Transcript_71649/m.200944 type:complete len:256 (-) Transcript_71649:55-822(-)
MHGSLAWPRLQPRHLAGGGGGKLNGVPCPSQGYVQISQVGEPEQETHSPNERKRFDAAKMQVSVYDNYTICSAMLGGFCCSSISTSHNGGPIDDALSRYFDLVTSSHQFVIRLSALLSVYAFVVFMLCTMYARAALARQGGPGWVVYDGFLQLTVAARQRAFYSMISAAILYAASILLSVCYAFPTVGAVGLVAATLLVPFLVLVREIIIIVTWASIVFMPDDEAEPELRRLRSASDGLPASAEADAESERPRRR